MCFVVSALLLSVPAGAAPAEGRPEEKKAPESRERQEQALAVLWKAIAGSDARRKGDDAHGAEAHGADPLVGLWVYKAGWITFSSPRPRA